MGVLLVDLNLIGRAMLAMLDNTQNGIVSQAGVAQWSVGKDCQKLEVVTPRGVDRQTTHWRQCFQCLLCQSSCPDSC